MDAFNALPGFGERFVPLHRYLIQALDLLYDHLRLGSPLPPDQVVRTRPRGIDAEGKAPPLTPDRVPPISDRPDPGNRIRVSGRVLLIPD
jgi:hydroxybutyrate-dimer hydrolase